MGGPGTGTLAGRGRTRGGEHWRAMGGPRTGTLAGRGRTPGWCRADHGAGVVLGAWGQFWGHRCGSGLSPCVSSGLERGRSWTLTTWPPPLPLLPSRTHETTQAHRVLRCSTHLSLKPKELPLVFSVRKMGVLLVMNCLDFCLKMYVLLSSLKGALQPEQQGDGHFHGFEDVPPFSSGSIPSVTSLNCRLMYGNSG